MASSFRGRLLFTAIVTSVIALPVAARATGPVDAPERPVVSASALYLVELQSGRVLLEQNAAQPLPPASLTKIMTALIALESAPLQEVVKIHPRAVVHHSSYHFSADERFLLRDLLTAMLVASANDACEAIAWHIGGDDKRFVAIMNERAVRLGLKNTHFANPCGFDAPGHYSTAADLAKLTEQALRQPFFSMMVRTLVRDIATVDGGRKMSLHSTNQLLKDPEVSGVKTGYTSKAGRCLIASMFKDGHRLLLVGLNLMDQWQQASRILRYGHELLQATDG
ncbi:MAG TPA: D-alanyl-D-alanine carboxypeptidase family protein [Nitrospira sp.]|jgi:serine-type D-Ala-D-Ala carboxypeptidase (penicillin-binding protein 5/6)|nr:D-alanyl-D-alanine carboxypeptidase family protein [Nitrospira sp.]